MKNDVQDKKPNEKDEFKPKTKENNSIYIDNSGKIVKTYLPPEWTLMERSELKSN